MHAQGRNENKRIAYEQALMHCSGSKVNEQCIAIGAKLMSKVLRDESEREQLALLADGFACATDNESLLAG